MSHLQVITPLLFYAHRPLVAVSMNYPLLQKQASLVKDELIYGHKYKNLGRGLILCPLSKIAMLGSPLGFMT